MKRPRFSIARMMAIVVTVALDFAAVRALLGVDSDIGIMIVVGSMPMASLLRLGIPSLAWAFARRGKIRTFPVGFEAVGWLVVLL